MKAKKIVTILLTVVTFLSAAFLGVSAVYRVEEVTLITHNVSGAAADEAERLKEKLEKAYLKRSTIFANDAAAKEAIASFAYFRLTGFEKDYPGRLVITATEDTETYAVARGEKFAIYSAEGTLLSVRESQTNRADGTDNLFVTGVEAEEDFAQSAAFTILRALDLSLSGVRRNVVKAEIFKPTSRPEDNYFVVSFREGVRGVIYAPDTSAQEKALALYTAYLYDLTLFQRTGGTIYVSLDCSTHYQRNTD